MSEREQQLSDYDEEQVLTDYLFRNYRTLLTELEVRVERTVHAEWKAERTNSAEMVKILQQRWGRESHPDIALALEDGVEQFRSRVRDRMISEHGAEIVVNRCPSCARIVATPRAKQCLWCGHDWHQLCDANNE